MVATREWPRARWGVVVCASLLLLSGFMATARWGLDQGYPDAVMALLYLAAGCFALERELWTWKIPGARLDSNRLETFAAPFQKELVVTPLDEVAGIDWEALGFIALRLRSGEVRTINTSLLRRRDRAEFSAALHGALAVRGAV